ncbi:unnamed protein product [Allacma fusca]|uniref:Calcitonin receptor n=1 Tax=Allacma fusca TaxID=39272 RepID=A0A8J2KMF5_9HEXA|nr:unnamed protein product [Allacma fusca]
MVAQNFGIVVKLTDGSMVTFCVDTPPLEWFDMRKDDPTTFLAQLELDKKLKCSFCPRIFDKWLCWNETDAGSTATAPCPDFIPGFFPTRNAHKACLEDGTWFRHPDSNSTWSNYTMCVDHADYEWRRFIISLYEFGYFLSAFALIVSLIIFCSFKCLECTRVRIHKHLFVSFIINNILWLAWYRLVVNDPILLVNNPWWCQTLHVFVQYFMVANYFWMFCEGFYLHTLLVLAFFRSETQLLKGFYVFGWMGPVLPMIFYVYCRATDTRDETCWVEQSSWNHILSIPVCLCLVLSLGFLINILRVLLKKLKDNQKNFSSALRRNSSIGGVDNQHSLKKAVRATLILIPLLGLHYLVIPFRPDPGSKRLEAIYEVVAAATSSLQGFCVALLFCFCNSEVINVFRRRCCPRMMEDKSPTHRADNSCAPTNRGDEKAERNESI